MAEYWFARRFPVGNPRNAMSPVTREGRMAFAWFIVTMIGGAAAWGILALVGHLPGAIVGALVFVGATVYAGWRLIALVAARGDQNHTVEDYRSGRVGGWS